MARAPGGGQSVGGARDGMTYSELEPRSGASAFLLVYFTLFLDNVLLTVLVPIIPDWLCGEALALWTERGAPLAALLNRTVQGVGVGAGAGADVGVGGAQLAVGAVLGARSAVQLAAAPLAATLTVRLGPARALRLATACLAGAALVFAWCGGGAAAGGCGGGGVRCALCAGLGRGVQGAGGALGGVSGVALVSRALRPERRRRALGALLGAVALGVLVGYPFGGAAYKMWSPAAPFQLIAITLLANLGLQYNFLNNPEYNEEPDETDSVAWGSSVRDMCAEWGGAGGGAGAGAGAVFASTAVMAALEPCLPLWVEHRFHPQRWALGAVFLPDSAGYLVTTSALPLLGGGRAAERVALLGALSVGLGAVLLPGARSLGALAACQLCIGSGVGAVDAALVPALLARSGRVPHCAALLQAAASAAFAIGPVAGGLVSWWAGFGACLRGLGVANLLYAGAFARHLARHPLAEQWGATCDDEESAGSELTPLDPLRPPAPPRTEPAAPFLVVTQ